MYNNRTLQILINIGFVVLINIIKIRAIQYTPIDIENYSNCALLIPNRDPSVTDILNSEFESCISYDAINQAFANARRRIINIPTIEDDWKPEDVATVGQLLLDISQQLAKQYNLNIEDVELGLPQIDTLKTAIAEVCPVFLSSISCRAGKYRRHDGLCNNVQHPSWGASNTPFTRLLPPQFTDQISAPRVSVTGRELPNPRIVSRTIHTDEGYHDHAGTLITVAWGQFLDHDFTLTGTPLDPSNRNEPEECCNRPPHTKNTYCMEIDVPEGDYFYSKFDIKCQDFVRAFPAAQPNCRLGSRTPFNTLTSIIDGNTVYATTDEMSRKLRAGHHGLLKMNPAFQSLGLKELLPMKTDVPDEGCVRTNGSQFCFLAGEIRVNEQLILTCIHTLMAREHNRIAKELAIINPHWDDEILFQESRRILIAEIQHITFNEFLPIILGKEITQKYDIELNSEGYWDGYNSNVNPGIIDAFAAAAYRFGHSLLPSAVERWSKQHRFIASKRLSELIRRPYDLYRAGVIDEYFMGLLNQVAQAMDDSVTEEVTNNLFKKDGNHFGLDLVSFNIQRGRDFGLPGYMYFRKHCGLRTADTFYEMVNMMPNSTIYKYMTIYDHPWDIDLWSGGVAELPLSGSLVGPTFACIIATQMNVLRTGDRFWYELPNQPSSFTPAQLREIKKIKLSRILCDNTDLLDTIQIYSMVLPDHDINPRVPCRSSILPRLDLNYWAETLSPPFADDNASSNTIQSNSSNVNPVYAYHIKTTAIIGDRQSLNISNLLENKEAESLPSQDGDKHRSKRETSYYVPPPDHISDLKYNENSLKFKRNLKAHAPLRRPTMTQAIMNDNQPSSRSRFTQGESGIEDFFRKSGSTYSGITPTRGSFRQGFRPFPYQSATQKEEEDDDEKEQPMSVEEVDPDHESQYEEVPMMVDQFGKLQVMSEPLFNSAPVSAPAPPSSSSYKSKYTGHNDYNHKTRPPRPNHYSEFNSYPSFDKHSNIHSDAPLSNFKQFNKYQHGHSSLPLHESFSYSPKYGTSHQFNSLADNEPRYYNHYKPVHTHQTRTNENSNSPNFNRPQASKFRSYDYPAESQRLLDNRYRTSVPLTIEEYHRLHNKAGSNEFGSHQPLVSSEEKYKNNFFSRAKKPKKPKNEDRDEEELDDKDEEDKDEKDDGFPSKSFVSMNFRNLNSDNGFSIRHSIAPSKQRQQKPFYDTPSQQQLKFHDRGDSSETFPNVAPIESSVGDPQFQDPSVIKKFVNTLFKPDKSKKDIQKTDKRFNLSPFNPNFGEKVGGFSKQPSSILWEHKLNSPRNKDNNFRSSILNPDKITEERETKILQKLSKELNIKPNKRDVFEHNITGTANYASTTSMTYPDAEESMLYEQADANEEQFANTTPTNDNSIEENIEN